MPLTNFPQGVSSFGIPLIGAGPVLTTGKVLFVNSSHGNASNGNIGESADRPLTTIAAALAKCSANNFDHIICGPGHVETITAADQLVIDVAGVNLIGLGRGTNRPTFNFTTTAVADMNVSAANVQLNNFLFTGGIDALSSIVDVTAADFGMFNCEYRDVTGQCAVFMNLSSAADRAHIRGFVHRGDSAAGTNAVFQLFGCANFLLEDFWIDGNFANAAIQCLTVAAVDLHIRNGYCRTRNAADLFVVDTITGSTGVIGPNIYLSLQDNAANVTEAITGATFRQFGDIRVVNANGEIAMDINTTVTTDA